MADEKLQALIDRGAVAELMQRYGMSIDTKDWAGLRSCFADEMEIDISETPFGTGAPPLRMSGDKWLEQIKRTLMKFAVTQHMISPYHVEVSGDQAVCMAYLKARHLPPDCKDEKSVWGLGGYYTNTMVRSPQGWKIRIWKLTETWQENAPNPAEVAPDAA